MWMRVIDPGRLRGEVGRRGRFLRRCRPWVLPASAEPVSDAEVAALADAGGLRLVLPGDRGLEKAAQATREAEDAQLIEALVAKNPALGDSQACDEPGALVQPPQGWVHREPDGGRGVHPPGHTMEV